MTILRIYFCVILATKQKTKKTRLLLQSYQFTKGRPLSAVFTFPNDLSSLLAYKIIHPVQLAFPIDRLGHGGKYCPAFIIVIYRRFYCCRDEHVQRVYYIRVLLYCFRSGSKAAVSLFPENYVPDEISDDNDR